MLYLRKCRTCGLEAHNEEELKLFIPHKLSLHGRANICRKCKTAYQRQWYKIYKDSPNYKRKRPRTRSENMRRREYNKIRRLKLIELYGGKCVCCGETHPEFLTLDHIQGNGATERKRLGTSDSIYKKAIKMLNENEEEARKNYRLLCWNCNCALGHYGYCPHNPKEFKAPVTN